MPPRTTAPPPTGDPYARRGAPVAAPSRPQADVTAVLVAHDGELWLPEALAALAACRPAPRRVLAVDTGSTDGTAALLAAATGEVVDRVLTLPRRTGYGAAVAAALEVEPDAEGGPAAWVWLLHDDVAPAPDALARLLEHGQASPSVGVLGPKVRDWDDPRVLVEVGLTTDRAGHRETGLESREYDQGQHDAVRDVLAVGTAGALVRRQVWDDVGGLDPALPVFRDDLDLGWRVNAAGSRVVVVPSAAVRHARAATTGRRRLHAVRGRAEGVDRRHALLVLLAHAPAWRLPLLVARLVLATAVRVLGFLATRAPASAGDELLAAGSVLLHPGRLRWARRDRSRTRRLPARALSPLFASRRARARARAEALAQWWSGDAGPAGRLDALVDAGPEEADDLPAAGTGLVRRAVARPGVLLVLGLLLVALVAERDLLAIGGGTLAGGRLLPAPGGASDLWREVVTSWHPVSVGTDAVAPPLLAVLALLSTLLLGKPWLAVDVLLLGCVPLAGATAYAAVSRLVRSVPLRAWAAATWALLPVGTGAVAAGRLDAAGALVVLPLLLPAALRLLTRPATDGLRPAWGVGLGLGLLSAVAPVLWPLLAGLLLVGALVAGRRGLRLAPARALVAAAVPLVLLLPWSAALVTSPGRLLHGPGRLVPDPALAETALPAWHLVLLSPGGAGAPPAWLTGGLVLAALAGTLRSMSRRLAHLGWALALPAVALALLLARVQVDVPASGLPAPVWPGVVLLPAAAGLLLAALVAGTGARARLAAADFGWRQVLAGGTALLAAAVPVLAAGAWLVRGAEDPLQRGARDALPAFAQADLALDPGLRVLRLRPTTGRVGYDLATAEGVRLGEADLPLAGRQVRALDAVVADLLSSTGSDAAAALATRAVRYVSLPGTGAEAGLVDAGLLDGLAAALDAQPGLVRRARGPVLLWQVTAPAEPLSLLAPGTAQVALRGDRAPDPELLAGEPPLALPGDLAGVHGGDRRAAELPPGPPGRLLVLAEAADPGWRATVNGRALPARTAWGWAAAFTVPEAGGTLRLERADAGRRALLVLQALALLVVLVLAAPGAAAPRTGLVVAERPRHARQGTA